MSRALVGALAAALALAAAARPVAGQGGVGVALGAAVPVARQQPAAAPDVAPILADDEVPLAVVVLAHRVAIGLTAPQLAQLGAVAAHLDSVLPPLDAGVEALRVRPTADDWRLVDETRRTERREQARVDLRDALAVLTPDQQALAWTMRGPGGGAPARGMARGMRRRGPAGEGVPRDTATGTAGGRRRSARRVRPARRSAPARAGGSGPRRG